jgi:hypothetical protein
MWCGGAIRSIDRSVGRLDWIGIGLGLQWPVKGRFWVGQSKIGPSRPWLGRCGVLNDEKHHVGEREREGERVGCLLPWRHLPPRGPPPWLSLPYHPPNPPSRSKVNAGCCSGLGDIGFDGGAGAQCAVVVDDNDNNNNNERQGLVLLCHHSSSSSSSRRRLVRSMRVVGLTTIDSVVSDRGSGCPRGRVSSFWVVGGGVLVDRCRISGPRRGPRSIERRLGARPIVWMGFGLVAGVLEAWTLALIRAFLAFARTIDAAAPQSLRNGGRGAPLRSACVHECDL